MYRPLRDADLNPSLIGKEVRDTVYATDLIVAGYGKIEFLSPHGYIVIVDVPQDSLVTYGAGRTAIYLVNGGENTRFALPFGDGITALGFEMLQRISRGEIIRAKWGMNIGEKNYALHLKRTERLSEYSSAAITMLIDQKLAAVGQIPGSDNTVPFPYFAVNTTGKGEQLLAEGLGRDYPDPENPFAARKPVAAPKILPGVDG